MKKADPPWSDDEIDACEDSDWLCLRRWHQTVYNLRFTLSLYRLGNRHLIQNRQAGWKQAAESFNRIDKALSLLETKEEGKEKELLAAVYAALCEPTKEAKDG